MIVLGLETSCDDTGAALVVADFSRGKFSRGKFSRGKDSSGIRVLSNVTAGQNDFHRFYGGVVPEIAARKHVEFILPVIENALKEASLTIEEVDAIAVTTHPGLISSLFVGVGCAKAIAYLYKKPLVAVSHLKAHFFSVPMDTDIEYPFIGLLVSGGHTLLAKCNSPLDVELLGSTLDDACGECFDKVAKYYGLGYPGGPAIENAANQGNADAYNFPSAQLNLDNPYSFSFSGLKTAVIHHLKKYLKVPRQGSEKVYVPDLAASLQKNIVQTLWDKTKKAGKDFGINRIGVCGGVAANRYLRKIFSSTGFDNEWQVFFPAMSLCTDNAGMVAGLGCYYWQQGMVEDDFLGLKPTAHSFKKERIL